MSISVSISKEPLNIKSADHTAFSNKALPGVLYLFWPLPAQANNLLSSPIEYVTLAVASTLALVVPNVEIMTINAMILPPITPHVTVAASEATKEEVDNFMIGNT